MSKLSNNELYDVKGGAISKITAGLAATFGIFIVGVIDGLIRPLKCHR